MSRNFLITLLGIIVTFIALCNFDHNPIIEGFGWTNTPMVAISQSEFHSSSGQKTAAPQNFALSNTSGAYSKGSFVQTPTFQSMLAPRFSNVQYGANIKYNMPDRKNLAVPCNALGYGDMANEGYQHQPKIQQVENYNGGCSSGDCGGSAGVASCGPGGYGMSKYVAGGYPLKAGYTADGGCLSSNWQQVYDSIPGANVQDASLPVATMTSVDSAGNTDNVVITDRLYSVNAKNRNRANADLIRGDLAITPCSGNWFNVSVNPATSLWGGAMLAMGGDGSSTMATIDMMAKSSGGTMNTNAGVELNTLPNYRAMLSSAKDMSVSSGSADVSVTAFP